MSEVRKYWVHKYLAKVFKETTMLYDVVIKSAEEFAAIYSHDLKLGATCNCSGTVLWMHFHVHELSSECSDIHV